MKGTGNNLSTIFRKLYLMLLPRCGMRSRYIKKHAYQFRHIGEGIMWQPRSFPSDPELIKDIPDNSIAAGVPCRKIGEFDALVEKYKKVKKLTPDELWKEFEKNYSL